MTEQPTSSPQSPEQSPPASEVPDRVECPTSRDPAVRLFIGAGIAFALGIWCILDLAHYPYAAPGEDINKFGGWAFNHGGAILGPLIGVVVLVLALRFIKRRVVAGSEGLTVSGKPTIPWEKVEAVDATQLADKGIVVVRAGQREVKLDSWKLQNFKPLVALIESKVPAEKMQR